jgi:hypothetical protein
MKRKGFFSEPIGEADNFRSAYLSASNQKHHRAEVRHFEAGLEENLKLLLEEFLGGSHHTLPYRFMTVREPKERLIGMLPFPEHVYQWAILNEVEPYVSRSFSNHVYGGIKGRGTHAYLHAIRTALRRYPERTTHYLQMDVRKFYPTIDLAVLKQLLRHYLKDGHLLSALDEIIDSSGMERGLYPGTKIAQFFALVYMNLFSHDLKRCFSVLQCPGVMDYYTSRYIAETIARARTPEDMAELSKGVAYLSEKFRAYCKRLDFVFGFVDDVIVLHTDTVFLHFVVEWVGMYLARELHIELNPKWHVGHVDKEGIDTGGYVHYHTHTRVRKRNKVALCRQVAEMKKKGLPTEEIRKACSSRIGFASHADSINLIQVLGMENPKRRLGQKIRDKRSPFPGLGADRKKKFEDILYDTRLPEEERGAEEEKEIELLDFKVEDSKIETEQVKIDGELKTVPKKCLVIRYNWQGEEWYSFTGSGVLIEQAEKEFSREDLPAPTVVKILVNKFNKKFYRFT